MIGKSITTPTYPAVSAGTDISGGMISPSPTGERSPLPSWKKAYYAILRNLGVKIPNGDGDTPRIRGRER